MYPTSGRPGFGTFVKRISESLESDFDVDSVFPTDLTNYKLVRYLHFWRRAVNKGMEVNYDLVYCHYCTHCFPALFVLWSLGRVRGLIVHVHGSEIVQEQGTGPFKYLIKLCIARMCLKIAKLVVVPSEYYSERVMKASNLSPKKLFVSPSGGVDISEPNWEVITSVPRFRLVFVGRLTRDKGILTLCDAIKLVSEERGIDLRLTVIGDGPLRNVLEQTEICEIMGEIENSAVAKVISNNSILIMPSQRESESLGLVGLEAMARGLIVIASDFGGPTTYIKNQINGFLFKSASAKSLAETLCFVFDLDEKESLSIRREAVETAKNYDFESVGTALRERFKSLLVKRPA